MSGQRGGNRNHLAKSVADWLNDRGESWTGGASELPALVRPFIGPHREVPNQAEWFEHLRQYRHELRNLGWLLCSREGRGIRELTFVPTALRPGVGSGRGSA